MAAGTDPDDGLEEMREGYEEGADAMVVDESSGGSFSSSSSLKVDAGGDGELPRNASDDADGDDSSADAGDDDVDLEVLYEKYHDC
jgi:hypothetical protein